MSAWERIGGQVGRIPAGVWVVLIGVNLVLIMATWSAMRRRLRRAGERVAALGIGADAGRSKDRALTVAAMIPAALFWGMVLAGSLHGLVAFGRTVLGWHDGWEYLVPGTLDGVSVTFAFLAFRAVRKQKPPDRCQPVVWGAALASATVNFAYEYGHSGHNAVAGGYLGLLSLFGVIMFHEFLDQFEEGTGYVKRENPKFGLRWLTWPTNTFCAALAWRNHPPVDGTPATVREAIANLDRVRELKAAAREAENDAQHGRALARIRRHAELRAAAGDEPMIEAAPAQRDYVTSDDVDPPASGDPARADLAIETSAVIQPIGRIAGVRVPAGAATVAAWTATWVKMCADGKAAGLSATSMPVPDTG